VPDFCVLWRALNDSAGDHWREVAVAPLAELLSPGAPDTVRCTPDSPVNYSGAPLDFPEGEEFKVKSPGAPDTVRWRPGHTSVIPLLSLLNPILGLFIG
jgi:hypothetical protein